MDIVKTQDIHLWNFTVYNWFRFGGTATFMKVVSSRRRLVPSFEGQYFVLALKCSPHCHKTQSLQTQKS